MPYIQIDLSSPISQNQRDQLTKGVLEIMSTILRKDPALTSVSLRDQSDSDWRIHNDTVATTTFVRAHVTQGSNSADEIEVAIARFHQLLEKVLADVDPVSYVVIDEVPAGHWGWGGKTQASRR